VNIRQRQARFLNARQRRDVGHLLGPLVALDRLDQGVVGEDQAIDAHVRPVAARDPPLARPDLLERTGVTAGFAHGIRSN